MVHYSSTVDHVAKKIARIPGVEASYIGRDGAIDAVLEKAFDRALREHVIQVGMRAMVPVRVFYRMPDGNIVGEAKKGQKNEAIEDFYTNIHVAGFAGSEPSAPPEEIAGDAQGDKDVGKEKDTRDDAGQLKLARIRSSSRGRQVLGWRYGKDALRVGDKVKFKEPCVLQWTMGRTVKVNSGMTGQVSQVASKSPMAYLTIGGHDGVELPVHAIGHVYDVMIDPALESKALPLTAKQAGLPPEIARLVMTVGFGRPPEEPWDTPTNGPKFKGRTTPNTIRYSRGEDEDMLVPKSAKDKAPAGKGDDRSIHTDTNEPKRILLGRK
jgi:hypothetical protein